MRGPFALALAAALCCGGAPTHALDPANLQSLGFLDMPFAGQILAVADGIAVTVAASARTVGIVRVAPVKRMEVLTVLAMEPECATLQNVGDVYNKVAYFACGVSGLSVLDISDPSAPAWLPRIPVPQGRIAQDVSILPPWAVVADPTSGVVLVNITDVEAGRHDHVGPRFPHVHPQEDQDASAERAEATRVAGDADHHHSQGAAGPDPVTDDCFALGMRLPFRARAAAAAAGGDSDRALRLAAFVVGAWKPRDLAVCLLANSMHGDTVVNATATITADINANASAHANSFKPVHPPSPAQPHHQQYEVDELAYCSEGGVPSVDGGAPPPPPSDRVAAPSIDWNHLPAEPQVGAGVTRLIRIAPVSRAANDVLMLSNAMGPGVIFADVSPDVGPVLWTSPGSKPRGKEVVGMAISKGRVLIASEDVGVEVFDEQGQRIFDGAGAGPAPPPPTTSPASPPPLLGGWERVATFEPAPTWGNITSVNAMAVDKEGLVYLAMRNVKGFAVYDLSDEAGPQLLGQSVENMRGMDVPISLKASDGHLVVTYVTGLAVYNIDRDVVISQWFMIALVGFAIIAAVATLVKWCLENNKGLAAPNRLWVRRDYEEVIGLPQVHHNGYPASRTAVHHPQPRSKRGLGAPPEAFPRF